MTKQRIVRSTQPQSAVGIDWSNPLAKGLIMAYLPGLRYDATLVTPKLGFFNGSNYRVSGASILYPGTTAGTDGIIVRSDKLLGPLLQSTSMALFSTTMTTGDLSSNGRGIYAERNSSTPEIYKIDMNSPSTTPQAMFTYRDNAGNLLQQTTPFPSLNDGKKHMIGCIKSGTAHSCFIDGSITTGTFSTATPSWPNVTPSTIGYDAGDAVANFSKGQIDVVLGWNRALSLNELNAMWHNPWQVFAPIQQPIFIPTSVSVTLPTIVQPSSDISTGSWTPSTGTTLYGCIDETPYSDTDYISASNATTCEVGLPPFVFPITAGVTLSYRAASVSGSTLTVSLKQNGAIITGCTWVHAGLSSTVTRFDDVLTPTQIAAITNPSVNPVSVTLTSS